MERSKSFGTLTLSISSCWSRSPTANPAAYSPPSPSSPLSATDSTPPVTPSNALFLYNDNQRACHNDTFNGSSSSPTAGLGSKRVSGSTSAPACTRKESYHDFSDNDSSDDPFAKSGGVHVVDASPRDTDARLYRKAKHSKQRGQGKHKRAASFKLEPLQLSLDDLGLDDLASLLPLPPSPPVDSFLSLTAAASASVSDYFASPITSEEKTALWKTVEEEVDADAGVTVLQQSSFPSRTSSGSVDGENGLRSGWWDEEDDTIHLPTGTSNLSEESQANSVYAREPDSEPVLSSSLPSTTFTSTPSNARNIPLLRARHASLLDWPSISSSRSSPSPPRARPSVARAQSSISAQEPPRARYSRLHDEAPDRSETPTPTPGYQTKSSAIWIRRPLKISARRSSPASLDPAATVAQSKHPVIQLPDSDTDTTSGNSGNRSSSISTSSINLDTFSHHDGSAYNDDTDLNLTLRVRRGSVHPDTGRRCGSPFPLALSASVRGQRGVRLRKARSTMLL